MNMKSKSTKKMHKYDAVNDEIQTQLLKCMCILRNRQQEDDTDVRPVEKSKWAVFWETIAQYSMSIVHDEDYTFNEFLTNALLNTEKSDSSKWLPLHCAAFYSTASDEHTKVLSLASTKSRGNRNEIYQTVGMKETPLHLASAANNPNINTIRHLLKYFPRMVSAETSTGQIPLHYAAKGSNNAEVIELLTEAYPQGLEKKCSLGEVPLFNACRNRSENSVQIIQKLLQASPQAIKSTNNKGDTPLLATLNQLTSDSSSSRLPDIIQALLTAHPEGAMTKDFSATSYISGNTPLHRLCFSLYISQIDSIFELLLKFCPAAASALNNKKQTPLHKLLRARAGHHGKDINKLVPMLLDVYPKAVSMADESGCFPIHYAVTSNLNITIIERIIDGNPGALLALGRRMDFWSDLTPIQMIFYDDTPAAKLCHRLALMKYLFSRCPESIHIRSDGEDTILHFAVRHSGDSDSDKRRIVEAVYHMDPSAAMSTDDENLTPLHVAVERIRRKSVVFPSYITFLLRMCPGAVSVPVGDEENLYDYVVANDYYDDDIEIRDLLHRMLLLAAPGINPQALSELNYKARRIAMFMFFSAVFESDDNIFTGLRGFDSNIVRRIIMFL